MTLTANRDVDHYIDQELRSFAVAGTKRIYKGAFLSFDANGYVEPLVAGNKCVGLAYEEIDNTSGADGDKSVRAYTLGDFAHALAGAALTDIGSAVYASADDVLTLTGTANMYVGHAIDVPSGGNIILRLNTRRDPATTIADPSGGATQDAEARTAINAILVQLETNGLTKSS